METPLFVYRAQKRKISGSFDFTEINLHLHADICSKYRSGIPFIGFDTSINPPTSKPFWLGKMGEEGKYVHIFDEISFEAILDKLDTIDDFTKYLEYKENIINKGVQIRADSELDLLANFFKNFNEKTQEHLYTIQKNQVNVPSNEWLSLYDDYGYVQGKKGSSELSVEQFFLKNSLKMA